MALFTGAIAGGCVGLHGIVGMALGIAVGIVPMMLFRRLRRVVMPACRALDGAPTAITKLLARVIQCRHRCITRSS